MAEELHFGRAAERLRMGQSPLSQQIRQLERELGVELIKRGHHVAGLTDAGKAFLEVARALLVDLDQGIQLTRRAGRGEVGTIVVGYVAEVTAEILPLSLKAYRERFPFIEIDLHQGTTGELLDALRRGRLDVAFVRHPGRVDDIRYEQLIEESMFAAVPGGHGRAGRCRSLADLAGEPFVLPTYATAQGLRRDIDAACAEVGLTPTVYREASPLTAVLLHVAAGAGVALVPASIVHSYPLPGIDFAPLADPPMTSVGMAWRRHNESQVLSHFLAITREVSAAQIDRPDVWPERRATDALDDACRDLTT